MYIKFLKIILIFSFLIISATSYSVELSIEIDGSNLPIGEGTIKGGEIIFLENCSSCHGYTGEGLIAPELTGGSEFLTGDDIARTIGNFWPYAPKIFDYIRRAKRDIKDNRFNDDQVYSLTGYLLNLNGLYSEKKINKKSLQKIQMPNLRGFINSYQEKLF